MSKKFTQRWVFTDAELKNPYSVKRSDEFLANLPDDPLAVVVDRRGKSMDRFADGVRGVGPERSAYAEDQDGLVTFGGEDADTWRNVWTNDAGDFLEFV